MLENVSIGEYIEPAYKFISLQVSSQAFPITQFIDL